MHEQVVRTDVVGELVRAEPQLERDVVFGIRAHAVVEDRLADLLMAQWAAGETTCGGRWPDTNGESPPRGGLSPSQVSDALCDDDWCRTTDMSCCGDRHRSRP
ncbi:hypothetical protein MMUR_66390 [Mycolicibacterium murale]|uniref:Uncharacterized protein n=1 Tax=Mycolicibacterium murale TaxID=182220 RepID=A0A7I9WXQ9_9MYCO|nr:hypothetical protein MMUR_66390 [Mycolicibacterium murale]